MCPQSVRSDRDPECGAPPSVMLSTPRVTLDPPTLRANIPDLPERDVFICGHRHGGCRLRGSVFQMVWRGPKACVGAA